MLKKIGKVIFFLPCLLIAFQIFVALDALINGTAVGLFGQSGVLHGFEAMYHEMVWGGFAGVLYIPSMIYQLIFVILVKEKFYTRAFCVQLAFIFAMELPLLMELS